MNIITFMSLLKLKTIIRNVLLESKKPKRLYVFDFDHTLAQTLETDFRSFGGLDPKTQPKKEIFVKFANKVENHPTMTFILTARPIKVKKLIIAWLNKHGVEILPKNVVCLGDSSPSKKRNWIQNKISKTNAIKAMFWDDKEENVDAVDKLNDKEKYPDMDKVKVVSILVPKND